jgi:hypothetical protein
MKSPAFPAALLVLVPVAASFVVHQEPKPAEASSKKPDPSKDPVREFARPGPEHKVLGGRVGKWNALVRVWNEPGGQPSFDTGTAEIRWILGERYIEETFEGTLLGQPFHGVGFTGFDNIKEKYFTTWMDSGGTGVLHSEGTFDAASQSVTYAGECPDANEWTYVKCRTVEKMIDADLWTAQMYTPGPDGKDFLCLDIAYRRAK